MADSDLSLEGLLARIPTAATPTTPNPQCCCGREDCAYLAYNGTALDNLEQEVRTAASLGQALLIRHEQYMVDAEKERLEMSTRIEKLESDKKELAAENARNIEDNRGLLDQLEELNSTVAESETHIKSLEATLQSTNQELRRLEGLASRTHDLEMQLAVLEEEQANLQRTVITTEAQERSAIQRWKKAERGIQDLNDQLERIERESQEERERHVEVLARMERQRTVERELDTAAGRLKGAAAVTSSGKNGSQVVSHFVKDILQDNANLQLGIVELREMLMNSNDEVQTLREQLALHSPRDENGSGQRTMRAEMGPKEETEQHIVSQALHIHHHYHGPAKKENPRPRKKRASLNSVVFTPPQMNSPRAPRSRATSNTILSQTSVTIPQPLTPNNSRWSVQSGQMSDFAPSSVPSSPISNYRHSGLFDRGFDSSRPTSPISSVGGFSVDPMSPGFQPYHRKRDSNVSTRSFAQPVNFQPENIIHEEDDDVEEIPGLEISEPSLEDEFGQSSSSDHSDVHYSESWAGTGFQSSLRRSTSHESILSISGIDIHTLKSRPSQITITGSSAHLRPRTRSSLASVETLTGSSMVTARPILSRQGHDSRAYLRSSMGQTYSDTDSIRSSNSNEGPGMGKKVGGWFVGRWGVSPAKSTNELRASAPSPTPSPQNRSVSTPVTLDPLRALMGRPPGVNQKGPIPGFKKSENPIPSIVTPVAVDHEALRETLLEAENLGT